MEKRIELWANSSSRPRARSTYDGSRLAEVQAEPEETARLQSFGETYKLAKPAEDKGELKLKGMLGVEVTDRYGIFITGEYGKAFNEVTKDGESYKVGVTLKAVF